MANPSRKCHHQHREKSQRGGGVSSHQTKRKRKDPVLKLSWVHVIQRSTALRVGGFILATTCCIKFFISFAIVSDSTAADAYSSLLPSSLEEIPDTSCRERMRTRLERIARVCRGDPEAEFLQHVYPKAGFFRTNVFHKTAVCAPHKVGSETWRYFFEKLGERDRNSTEWKSCILNEWPQDGSEKKFVKAYQVRHPLERVLSAYRYVFEQTTLHQTNGLSVRILERFDSSNFKPENKDSLFPYRNVTFKEFVMFLTHQDEFPDDVTERGGSSHWRPYHLQCNPCHPDFRPDFIVTLETVDDDAECYLSAVEGLIEEDYEHLFIVNSHPHGQSSQTDIKKEFFGQLNRQDVEELAKVYRLDHELYGYSVSPYLELAAQEDEAP